MIQAMSMRVNRSNWGAMIIDHANNTYYWARFLIRPLGTANGAWLDPEAEEETETAGIPAVNEYHFHLVISNSQGQRFSINNATKQETIQVCKRDGVLMGEFKEFPVNWQDATGFRGWIVAGEEELPE